MSNAEMPTHNSPRQKNGASQTPAIAVVGATGTGKSALAIELAQRLNGEIINTDALQFYRGMDIGTAKVTAEEREIVAHHLLDVLDIHEEASLASFQRWCAEAVADIISRGKTPIFVGGSGLYTRAALDNLELPPTDPAVRAMLEERAEREGISVLAEELRSVDPESAEKISDARRIIRALEVHALTGRPFTAFMPQRQYLRPTIQIGLSIERPVLHDRLEKRVKSMMEQGFLQEVRDLQKAGLRGAKTASAAIGYRQMLSVLDGELSEQEAVAETITATRRFARRQETWYRADPRITWLAWDDPALKEHAEDAARSGR